MSIAKAIIFATFVSLAVVSPAFATLRGAAQRRLNACDASNPDLPNLPGVRALGYGFNLVNGEQSTTPLFATDVLGNDWSRKGVTKVNGVCYKVPDVLINPQTGVNGVVPAHLDDQSFTSAVGTSAMSFQKNWAKQQSNKFSMSGSYGEISGHAAYTHSKEMTNVINHDQSGKTSMARLHNSIEVYRAMPHEFKIQPEGINTLTRLVADDAPFRDDDGLFAISWETYFKTYGTHVITQAAMGGEVIIQYFFDETSSSDSTDSLQKNSDCLSAGISVGLKGKGSVGADTENCFNSTNGKKTSAEEALKKHRGHVSCKGGATGVCPQISTEGIINPADMAKWKATLSGDNLSPIILKAEWVDIQLGVIAAEQGTNGWKVMGFSSEQQFKQVRTRMHEMLMVYLQENGMCAVYPTNCGVEKSGLDALRDLSGSLGALNGFKDGPIGQMQKKTTATIANLDAVMYQLEEYGEHTVAQSRASAAYQGLTTAKLYLQTVQTNALAQGREMRVKMGQLVLDTHKALNSEPKDLPAIDPTLKTTCVTTGGVVPEGSQCVFPFIYKGVSYDSCAMADHTHAWCSTDADYVGNWGNCGKCTDPNAKAKAAKAAATKNMSDGITAAQKELAALLRTTADGIAKQKAALQAVTHGLQAASTSYSLASTSTPVWNQAWLSKVKQQITNDEQSKCDACWANLLAAAVCFPVCMGNLPGVVDKEVEATKTVFASVIQTVYKNIELGLKPDLTLADNVMAKVNADETALRYAASAVDENASVQKSNAVTTWWHTVLLPEMVAIAHTPITAPASVSMSYIESL